jgi:hypothetical protein
MVKHIKYFQFKRELVFSEKFYIESVLSEPKVSSSEICLADRNHLGGYMKDGKPFDDEHGDNLQYRYIEGGYETKFPLRVKPFDKKCITNELIFEGNNLNLIKGNMIEAKICLAGEDFERRCKDDQLREDFLTKGNSILNFKHLPIFYKRNFEDRENAIEISLINLEGEVLRTDRSIHYPNYFEDSLFQNP